MYGGYSDDMNIPRFIDRSAAGRKGESIAWNYWRLQGP